MSCGQAKPLSLKKQLWSLVVMLDAALNFHFNWVPYLNSLVILGLLLHLYLSITLDL